jgi:hypothetical protein
MAGSRTAAASNTDIISSLGIGIVRFTEQPEELVITDYDYEYRVDTDVITSVEISGGQADPDNPVSVQFNIDGRSYTVSEVYYPEAIAARMGEMAHAGRAVYNRHLRQRVRPRLGAGYRKLQHY